MLRQTVFRQLLHIQKSLLLRSNIASLNSQNRRLFADDPNDKSSVKVLELEKESETTTTTTTAVDVIEGIPVPPKMPTYQTKTPMELIAEVPVIEIDGPFVKCDGMYFNSDMTVRVNDPMKTPHHPYEGHPMQWITLNTRKPFTPQTCKYCGLRYVMKKPDDYVDPWANYQKPTNEQS